LRHYELVAILSPMLNQDEATSAWADIKSFIGNRDGEITAEQIWGTRRLAYPIRKGSFNFLEGSYYLSSFAVESAFNKELETYLRLDERVLRSLVIRCDGPLEDRPAPGPLTAPSRYIPPGRGRRPDGGGPIPEAPGGSPDRRPEPAFAPPVAAPAAVAEPPTAPDAPTPPSAEPTVDAGVEPQTTVTPDPAPVVDAEPVPAPQPEAAVETPPDAVVDAAEPPASEPAAGSDTDAQA
jgi:small subunit ribosomal protein S6